jgi:hypothetical protein
MVFPSTRTREVALELSVSLRSILPSMLSGTGHVSLRLLLCEPREPGECQLVQEYIVAPGNIHSWMAIDSACRLGLRCAIR